MQMDNQSTKYGNVQKCPQCGAPVEPMAVKCSTCGYEFRNVEALKSSQVLSSKLEEIERAYRNKGNVFTQHDHQIYKAREQGTIIKNFPIPTTKEDLLDFAITMQSKWKNEDYPDLRKSYKTKYDECVNKAKILFPNDPMFQGVFEQYQVDKNKKGCSLFILIAIIATSVLWVVL